MNNVEGVVRAGGAFCKKNGLGHLASKQEQGIALFSHLFFPISSLAMCFMGYEYQYYILNGLLIKGTFLYDYFNFQNA